MKKSVLLIPFFVVLISLTLGLVSAGEIISSNSLEVEFNGVDLSSSVNIAGVVGEVVPVRVSFESNMNTTDVRVKISMEGHRNDVSDSSKRFDVVDGSVYTKLLSLRLPSDIKDLTKEFTLFVEIVSSNDKSEGEYIVKMQRESYTLEILSVDYSSKVSAGNIFPVSVVAKNSGYNRADDNYVVVSIPELSISTRGYAGDLIPVETLDYDHEEDSFEEVVYLKIPEDANSGVYEMEIKVYNRDSSVSTRKLISVDDSGSLNVLAAVKNKDLNAGDTITYDLIIVNSADDVKVFNLDSVSGDDLIVSVPSVVTVGSDSSETVSISVKASKDADVGTYTFSVDINGKQVVFAANVVGSSTSSSTVVLTIVLVIIFIALLALLVFLLTKREATAEEVETSYY
tara:strand:- start:4617 stop:5813 length:1197 start_codon:yes stop_codon:yes gene_type:complete